MRIHGATTANDVAGSSLTRRSSASHWQKKAPAACCRSFIEGQHLRCRTKKMSLLRCISAQPHDAAGWKISEMAQFVHLLSYALVLHPAGWLLGAGVAEVVAAPDLRLKGRNLIVTQSHRRTRACAAPGACLGWDQPACQLATPASVRGRARASQTSASQF